MLRNGGCFTPEWVAGIGPESWPEWSGKRNSRTDLLADYFDDWLYSRSTFGKLKPWPYLVITATDLFTGQRFNFNETQFNCIGSEYEKFRLAHAVAASSAYPLFFPTLTLKNFNYPQPERIQPDRKRGPYIPLSDGGLVDNYATRVYLELLGRGRLIGDPTGRPRPPAKAFVFIRIDASRVDLDASPDSPSLLARVQRAFDVASEQQIKDSDYLFTSEIERVWDRWKTNCDAKPPFQYKYINARLRNGSPDLQKIPTRWTLDDDEIKLLIKEGSDAIKAQKESIQEFLELLPRSGKEDLICHHSTPEVAAIETPDH